MYTRDIILDIFNNFSFFSHSGLTTFSSINFIGKFIKKAITPPIIKGLNAVIILLITLGINVGFNINKRKTIMYVDIIS